MTPQHLHQAGIFALRRPGTSLPLVLLHGIGSDAESWVRMMSALPPAIDVIAWNAPGYESSAALANTSPTPDDYADSLAALLDALGLPRVVLAGHSLGTLFAARFALMFPQRVAALALLSPAFGYGIAPGEPLPAGVQGRVDDLVRLGPTEFAATQAAKLVFHPDDKPEILAGVRRGMGAVRMPGYGQAVRALGAGTLLADVAQIAAPTLVAVGAEDVVTPPANAQATYDAAPNKRSFTLVPGAGHALPQEDPAVVAQLLGALVMEAQHV